MFAISPRHHAPSSHAVHAEHSGVPTILMEHSSTDLASAEDSGSNISQANPKLRDVYLHCRTIARSEEGWNAAPWCFYPGYTRRIRHHLWAVLAFVTAAESLLTAPAHAGRRRAAIDDYEQDLVAAFHGGTQKPAFIALAHTVFTCQLPLQPFVEYLDGCRMELNYTPLSTPFVNFSQLRAYCHCRSQSLGRIIMLLCGQRDEEVLGFNEDLCIGLKLVALLADTSRSLKYGRCLFPIEDLRHFGIHDHVPTILHGSDMTMPQRSSSWGHLIRFECARARMLLERGRPLADYLDGPMKKDVRRSYHTAQAMLDEIQRLGESILHIVPQVPTKLGATDPARVEAIQPAWPRWFSAASPASEPSSSQP